MATQTQFQILKITARSDHPVRNSLGHLVFGSHVLWEKGNPSNEDKGSLAPNVFSYDFKSPVAASSSIHVTVEPLGAGLGGGEYRLHGTFDNVVVFESEFVSVDSMQPITITVNVVQPEKSLGPFSWSDVPGTLLGIERCGSDLFAGRSGIPVDLLRNFLPGLQRDGLQNVMDVPKNMMQSATLAAYNLFSKTYDTVQGAPKFGVTSTGGSFQLNYYIAAAPGGTLGSLQRIVNCYDRAAMVQVLATVGLLGPNRPSWLRMLPFGFIDKTRLVGIPQDCNNPFFRSVSPPLPPLLPINDPRRTPFGNHVFNGYLTVFNRITDRIYDACGGPIDTGLPPPAYVHRTVDSVTTLHPPPPGTVMNIKQFGGVTAVLSTFHQDVEPSKTVEDLLQMSSAVAEDSNSLSQIHWDDVAQWVKSIIGESIKVAVHEVRFADAAVEALWHLIGVDHRDANGDDNLIFRVKVHTLVGPDGKLDYKASSAQAQNDLRFSLTNNDRNSGSNDQDLESFWEPAPFKDFAQHSIRLKSTIPQGRFLIASGNSLIDVSGGPSSSSIESIVRKVLSHTTVDKPLSYDIPGVIDHHFEIPHDKRGGKGNVVKGIATSFAISCKISNPIAAASASVKDGGLLFHDATIVNDEKTSTVKFEFVTRKIGEHGVELAFATSLGLTSGKKIIQVAVIE